MRVGVISDTHGLMRPEALRALAGSELIVHAGDIGGPDILAALRAIAPLVVVRGNNDFGSWAEVIPEAVDVEVAGRRVHVVHDVADAARVKADIIITGHSHQPRNQVVRGTLMFNPGSAGPRRFTLPITVGILRFHGAATEPAQHSSKPGFEGAEIVTLLP